MARLTKEQSAYLMAMQRALDIVKSKGVEELEKEVNFRCNNRLPLNVSPDELTEIARLRVHDELMCVSTALATALTDGLKLAPSYITEFLIIFNQLVDVYRADPEALKKAMDALGRYPQFDEIQERYSKYKEDNKQ